MRRTLLITTAFIVAALTLGGCSAGLAQSSAGDEAAAPQTGVVEGGTGGDGGVTEFESGEVADSTDTGVVGPAAEREVIVTGDVTITADDPVAASRDAVRIVEAAGGRVDGRTEYAPTDGDAGSATLVLRIPADKLTATLDQLEDLGRADQVSLSTADVTVQSQDLDARISALTASIERINVLVAKATTIDDLIRLETEVSSRQAELESLQAQQRYLADQVSMSTVTLYLRSEAAAPSVDPGDFWSGLATGWAAFVGFWAGLLVVVGVLLPWIVSIAIIAGIVILVLRRRKARRVPAVAEPAAQADEPIKASNAKP